MTDALNATMQRYNDVNQDVLQPVRQDDGNPLLQVLEDLPSAPVEWRMHSPNGGPPWWQTA